MNSETVVYASEILVGCVVLFGGWYVGYRFLMGRSADLGSSRDFFRFFGVFAAILVFLVLLIRQLVVRDSWAWPLLAPVGVLALFAAHDQALRLAMRGRGKPAREPGTAVDQADERPPPGDK